MADPHEEWLRQADYDMETAEALLLGGRCLHAVFTCHLAIEKALKGLFQARLNKPPPKTHNLVWLLDQVGERPPEGLGRFLLDLNECQAPTRYPDSLAQALRDFPPGETGRTLRDAREMLQWIRERLPRP